MDIFKAIKNRDSISVSAYIKEGGNLNVRDFYNMTPLIAAADEGQSDIVKLFIKSKCDINAKDKMGQTALFIAAGRNNVEIVKLLIEAKADINIKHINPHFPDEILFS
jgi:uncharacterized protein